MLAPRSMEKCNVRLYRNTKKFDFSLERINLNFINYYLVSKITLDS